LTLTAAVLDTVPLVQDTALVLTLVPTVVLEVQLAKASPVDHTLPTLVHTILTLETSLTLALTQTVMVDQTSALQATVLTQAPAQLTELLVLIAPTWPTNLTLASTVTWTVARPLVETPTPHTKHSLLLCEYGM